MSALPDAPNTSHNDEALYNIGVVTRMTGISMATLRAWERRYEFPQAKRTSGGHRLYSEGDVQRLRWVKERIEEGMNTAQAIQALRFQEEHGTKVSTFSIQYEPDKLGVINGSLSNTYRQHLSEALFDRKLENADQILSEALATSSPEDLILQVITPVLAGTGEAWEHNRISVATEHLATNYLRQRLLMWMLSGPPARSMPPVVLACAPQEWHEGSLLVLGALLRRRRIPVAYLGQNVPLEDLSNFVREINPKMVVLVAMTETTARELVRWPEYLPEPIASGHPVIGYGGRVFNQAPEWRMRMQGLFLGESLIEGINSIENVINR